MNKSYEHRKKDLIMLLISLVVVSFFWIGFNVYHAAINSTISATLNTQIIPIEPNFNSNAVESLKARTKINPLYQTLAPSPSPTLQPTNSPAASASSGLNQNSASNSGQILQ